MHSAYYIVTAVVVIAALFAGALWIYLRRVYAAKRRPPELKPLELKFLAANVGNASAKRALSLFKLNNDDIPVLRRNIEALNPDIIVLQELWDEDQMRLLIDTEQFHTHCLKYNCVAVRKEFFDELDHAGETDGYSIYEAKLRKPVGNLTLFNVHMPTPLGDPTFSKRGALIRSLLGEMRERSVTGAKIIAAGDFNFDPYRFESFRHRIMKTDSETELDWTKAAWHEMFDAPDGNLPRIVSSFTPTWNFANFSYTIDHIAANIPFSASEVLCDDDERLDIDHTDENEDKKFCFMDHRAVTARFTI